MKAEGTTKKLSKEERERRVLFGLVEYYIKTGKAVGSTTLKNVGFGDLSSATIRNYFSNLEKQGYLHQPHTSGGRVPTERAMKLYAKDAAENSVLNDTHKQMLAPLRASDNKEIAAYLQNSADLIASMTHCAVFLSAPRFDHDYIIDIKLLPLNDERCLCAMVSDFGAVKVEILHVGGKMSTFSAKRIESYFHWRLTGHDKPEGLEPEEEELAKRFYNELILRYVIGYSTFTDADIHRTGFSRLLAYPDFRDDTSALANSLSLFENAHHIRLLLKECSSLNSVKYWIGEELTPYSLMRPQCTILAIPYTINQQPVGAIGIMGPIRLPYRELFGILNEYASAVSEALTRNIYKFKISFRQPSTTTSFLPTKKQLLTAQADPILIEDQSD